MCMGNTRLGGGRSDDGTLPGASTSGASEMTATGGPVAPAFLTRRSMLNTAATSAAGARAPSILGGTGTSGGGRAPGSGGYSVRPQ